MYIILGLLPVPIPCHQGLPPRVARILEARFFMTSTMRVRGRVDSFRLPHLFDVLAAAPDRLADVLRRRVRPYGDDDPASRLDEPLLSALAPNLTDRDTCVTDDLFRHRLDLERIRLVRPW
jgi:hypothetical protein